MSRDLFAGYEGTGTLNIASAGTVSAGTTYAGFFGSGTGTITIDGANSLLTTGGFVVGREGEGHVTATNGGAIESQSGIIGREAGSVGSVDLQSGSLWIADTAVTVGAAGTGTLTVAGGSKLTSDIATVGRNVGGAGTVTVSGNGSNWTNTGDFTIARDGAGAMTVTGDGATVNSGRLLIGGIASADGTLTLAHDGKWTSTQDAVIGAGGTGKLRIESGGWLTTIGGQVGTAAGSNGTVEINSAAASNKISTWDATTGDITVGGAGGTGKITVTQGSNLETQNLLLAASGGGSATVDVSARGTILTKNTLIGTNGGAGAFTVSGDQTLLRATSFLRVGHNGDGSLLVNDKGHVWADRLHIGNVGTGSVTVSNQALVTATVGLRVGDTSNGTLTVNSGGTVVSDGAAIGLGPGSTGAVLVTGVGTQWNALGALGGGINVGDNGNASLTVTDQAVLRANAVNVGTLATSATLTASGGATVTSGNLTIGHGPGRKGTATITGAGTNWTANGGVFAGLQADGALTIADGARLRSADSSIGGFAGAAGNVLVTGANSVWDLGAGVINVGGAGAGTLTVENGGRVIGDLDVLGGGTLRGNGNVGNTSIRNGGTLVGVQGQTLTVDGYLALSSGSNVSVALGAPGNVTGLFKVNGDLALDGTLNVTNAGGFGQGIYRIADYTGSLADNGLIVGTTPSGTTGTVQTAVANQVNLLVSGMANDTQFWNGSTTTADGAIHGGNGTWRAGPTNWTDANGTTAAAWGGQFAVFQNNPGIVTVDNSAGGISTTGMQFIGAGWIVSGDDINLAGGGDLTTIRVGDGSAAAAGHSATIASNLTSFGGLVKQDLGTLILTGENSYSGGTDIAAGTLQIGDGGTAGSITGDVRVTGTLGFNRSDAYAFGGSISGNGAIRHVGSGTTTLTGSSSFTGTTSVESGTLAVNGQLGGSLSVLSGGTLTGTGTVGAVSVANGGILAGTQGQTLTTGNLMLASGSSTNVSLGMAGNSTGLFNVNGNLTLDGTLNVANAGGFGQGVYRIFDYTGSLTDNGMNVGTMPSGTGTIQTAMANQVNLVVDNGGPVPAVQFWNGTTTVADGTIHGGNGTWVAGPTNWTNANGSTAAAWGGQFAVFQNNPGLVTVDNQAGAIATTGMQFIGDGWRVGGQALTLNGAGGNTTVRVGDGTIAGASWSATVASELTGNSRLVKDDLGTLILTGANSYTGGTTIAAGTLQIGDAGTSGSITGDVLNNGLLRFARTDATTFGGLISGSGAVHVAYGQLTLTGDNTYTGTTTIGSVASLTLGNGGTTGSVAGNIVNSGLLRFNRSNDFTYAGEITGFGAIRQVGSGKTELTGNSSAFTGTTRVESGILAVNGQLGGSLDVWTGGRLQGTGTVGNTIVSGVIAPGNSIGTINVGNITFNAGSIYEVEVNAAGQSDKILASGTATINGGSVQVLAGAGNYAPATTYTILTAAGGRTGTFTEGVTSNLAFLDPSLSYDANNVYLTMTRNDILFQNVGVTPNQIATGGGAESLGLGNAVYDAVLNLSAPQAQYAFDQLSGELHASAKTAMLEDSRFIRNAVNDRIRAAFDGVGASNGTVVTYDNGKPQTVAATTDGGAVWGHAFGAWGHWNGDGNAARLDRSIGGFFVGADAPAFDTWRFGAVAGYSRTSFDAKDRHSSGTSDNYHVGLYGGTNWGDLAFRTGAAYTWHDISTNRSVIFPGFGNSLTGDYGASTAQVFGELGYKMQAGNVAFEPFANLAYVNLHTEGFTEKGGAAALTSGSSSTDATFTTLGLRAASSFNLAETVVTAKGMVGWRHAFGDVTPDSVMRFAGGGNAFTIGGVPIARNAAVVEAGLDFALSPTATLGVSYGGQFGSGVVDQSVRANFNVKF